MTPFFFGTAKRRLYGALDPGQSRSGKAQAAVICYPWGSEYLYAHRTLRHLARLLAVRGCHILRFDYHGTGDSAGDDPEVRLSGWRQDISTAMDELKETCGARSVHLIGLRLGAALAAEVATFSRDDVAGLVLWDPAVSGPEHLDGLEAEWRKMTLEHRPHLGEDSERTRNKRFGLPISDELAIEIDAIDLIKIATKMPARTLCISTERLNSHDAFRGALDRHPNGSIGLEEISDVRPWIEPDIASAGALPLGALNRIVTWLVP
jgi:pimeloyl-ACP methyl ester carboxylesterase